MVEEAGEEVEEDTYPTLAICTLTIDTRSLNEEEEGTGDIEGAQGLGVSRAVISRVPIRTICKVQRWK